jgi:hypothetical protein
VTEITGKINVNMKDIKCVEGNLEIAGIPDPLVDVLDGFFCVDCVKTLRECE